MPVMEPEVEVEEVVVKANPPGAYDFRVRGDFLPAIADNYDRAAELLEQYGWVQGKYGDIGTGGFCLMGAIAETSGPNRGYYQFNAIMTATGGAFQGGTTWNDFPGRTKEEVIAKLREVAAQLRG